MGNGAVYELTSSGSGWTEKVLYSFQFGSDGGDVYAGLILDQAGNLYGAAASGGLHNGGTVFQLIRSDGKWTFETLYALSGIHHVRVHIGSSALRSCCAFGQTLSAKC